MFKASDKAIILVTGSNGQLGHEFRRIAALQDEYEFLFTTRESMDITNPEEIKNVFSKWAPHFCINCAAYTAVDKAETEKDLAYAINEHALQSLIEACDKSGTTLINYSTDYVYDSVIDHPIQEDDTTSPRSVYGLSKRAGELQLEKSAIEWINLRVSWLYSTYKNNFVKTMLRLGRDRDELNIVSDQIGTPTYARDLAVDTIKIISQTPDNKEGTKRHYNYSNMSTTNWADFARAIFRIKNIECQVHNTSTADYGAPAPRPLWSVMDKSRLLNNWNLELTMWEDSLESCLGELD